MAEGADDCFERAMDEYHDACLDGSIGDVMDRIHQQEIAQAIRHRAEQAERKRQQTTQARAYFKKLEQTGELPF